jgi:hypothetical protein
VGGALCFSAVTVATPVDRMSREPHRRSTHADFRSKPRAPIAPLGGFSARIYKKLH